MAKSKRDSFEQELDKAAAFDTIAEVVAAEAAAEAAPSSEPMPTDIVKVFSLRPGTMGLPDGRELKFNATMNVERSVAEMLVRVSGGKVRIL